jgi:hypothetical protein
VAAQQPEEPAPAPEEVAPQSNTAPDAVTTPEGQDLIAKAAVSFTVKGESLNLKPLFDAGILVRGSTYTYRINGAVEIEGSDVPQTLTLLQTRLGPLDSKTLVWVTPFTISTYTLEAMLDTDADFTKYGEWSAADSAGNGVSVISLVQLDSLDSDASGYFVPTDPDVIDTTANLGLKGFSKTLYDDFDGTNAEKRTAAPETEFRPQADADTASNGGPATAKAETNTMTIAGKYGVITLEWVPAADYSPTVNDGTDSTDGGGRWTWTYKPAHAVDAANGLTAEMVAALRALKAYDANDATSHADEVFTFITTDTQGAETRHAITIEVRGANDAPELTQTGSQLLTINDGTSANLVQDTGYRFTATDADGTTSTLSVSDARFQLAQNGTLQLKAGQAFTADEATAGSVRVVVTATDATDSAVTDIETVDITITPMQPEEPAPANQQPTAFRVSNIGRSIRETEDDIDWFTVGSFRFEDDNMGTNTVTAAITTSPSSQRGTAQVRVRGNDIQMQGIDIVDNPQDVQFEITLTPETDGDGTAPVAVTLIVDVNGEYVRAKAKTGYYSNDLNDADTPLTLEEVVNRVLVLGDGLHREPAKIDIVRTSSQNGAFVIGSAPEHNRDAHAWSDAKGWQVHIDNNDEWVLEFKVALDAQDSWSQTISITGGAENTGTFEDFVMTFNNDSNQNTMNGRDRVNEIFTVDTTGSVVDGADVITKFEDMRDKLRFNEDGAIENTTAITLYTMLEANGGSDTTTVNDLVIYDAPGDANSVLAVLRDVGTDFVLTNDDVWENAKIFLLSDGRDTNDLEFFVGVANRHDMFLIDATPTDIVDADFVSGFSQPKAAAGENAAVLGDMLRFTYDGAAADETAINLYTGFEDSNGNGGDNDPVIYSERNDNTKVLAVLTDVGTDFVLTNDDVWENATIEIL